MFPPEKSAFPALLSDPLQSTDFRNVLAGLVHRAFPFVFDAFAISGEAFIEQVGQIWRADEITCKMPLGGIAFAAKRHGIVPLAGLEIAAPDIEQCQQVRSLIFVHCGDKPAKLALRAVRPVIAFARRQNVCRTVIDRVGARVGIGVRLLHVKPAGFKNKFANFVEDDVHGNLLLSAR